MRPMTLTGVWGAFVLCTAVLSAKAGFNSDEPPRHFHASGSFAIPLPCSQSFDEHPPTSITGYQPCTSLRAFAGYTFLQP
jgi:hypothetical protein